MASKKVKTEVEGIRNELQNLSEAVWALREHVTIQTAAAAAAAAPGQRVKARPAGNGATDLALAGDLRGTVLTRGVVRDAEGEREYRWEAEVAVSELLATDGDHASRLLAAIGHRQRLAILKMVLDKPATAAELVNALELGTTGAAYHHLNVLQSADLVSQEGRGMFAVRPERVAALFAMLSGIEAAASVTAPEPAGSGGEADDEAGRGKRRKKKGA